MMIDIIPPEFFFICDTQGVYKVIEVLESN